ncbi:hypothetical protein [Lacipirellula sp.]|uniref:hypothetical protein n=1 Tax=Lacipirellula sp. TaxID=2691419 RepID=UPI003D0CBB76
MSAFQKLLRNPAAFALAALLTTSLGCGSAETADKTPEDLEKIRTEMKATTDRELSGSK